MTKNNKLSVETMAKSVVDDAANYVNSVSEMANSHELHATKDIISASGIKLIARGTRIDERLREKLCGHKLSGKTLEKSLAITDGVTLESLSADIAKLIGKDAWLTQLEVKSGDPGAMRHGISRLKLPPEVIFRLTVARNQRPDLYQHSLNVVIICHYLALRLHLAEANIDNLLIAALCHDLGELYTSPAMLEPGHKVTDEERRFIYVHPITGWLIVRELSGLDPEVATAILQHHERLDGSGYPNALKSGMIGLAGRILATAEVSATIMARFSNHHRLSTLLRLNSKKYDRKVVGLLQEAIVQEPVSSSQLERKTFTQRLGGFASLLDSCTRLQSDSEISKTAPVTFLKERMYNLQMILLESGFDPDSLETIIEMAQDDAIIAAELTTVVDELQFQLGELRQEFERRSPTWQDAPNPRTVAALDDWRQQLQACIEK